uniref:Uncharacterized protein n=1 Tax=Anguilla anguilla TaxID=7936 RepID=A0A0E9T9P4_ANGAN
MQETFSLNITENKTESACV